MKTFPLFHQRSEFTLIELLVVIAGVKLAQPRWRSYNLSLAINGASDVYPWWSTIIPSLKKFTQINNPDPASLFMFLEAHEDSIIDPGFGMPPLVKSDDRKWWDLPADHHAQGCNLAFADGHAEHWKWRVSPLLHWEACRSSTQKRHRCYAPPVHPTKLLLSAPDRPPPVASVKLR